MDALELYQTIQSSPRGHSGKGMSYYTQGATCGRKVNLSEKYAEKVAAIRAQEAEENDGDDALSIGTYYHALHELALRGQDTYEVWDQTDEALSANFLEAVRLYRGYKDAWGSPLERWGAELIGVETLLQDEDRSGRADALFRVVDTERAYENTGLLLPEPGIYIMDWKTGKAKSDRDVWEFGFGNQSINYLDLARRTRPDLDIKGMIFDKIIRHKQLRKDPEYASTGKLKGDKSFWAYLAQYQPGDEAVVNKLIQIGKRNVELNEANPAACFSGAKPCPFFAMGLCNRY